MSNLCVGLKSGDNESCPSFNHHIGNVCVHNLIAVFEIKIFINKEISPVTPVTLKVQENPQNIFFTYLQI